MMAAEKPSSHDLRSTLISARKRLAAKKDPDSIRDAELLKRALNSEFVVDRADDDWMLALVQLSLVAWRASPAGTSADQLVEVLAGCSGTHVTELPRIVEASYETAQQLGPLFDRSRPDPRVQSNSDEFVLEVSGTRAGLPAACNLHNFDVALNRLGIGLYYDLFSRKKFVTGSDGSIEVLQDYHVNELIGQCFYQYQFLPSKELFHDHVSRLAWRNPQHPVLSYLDGLPPWDGVPRVEEWLIKHAEVEDTPFVRAISRLVLVAAVRRVRQPGCKFDEMLILEGDQGTLKSSALAALCPNREWFMDDFKIGLDTKTQMERTNGKWIVEAGELKGLTNGDLNDLKANLSRCVDEARMAYGHEVSVVRRQFIVIGTVNEEQYLRDPTGDRRFWPVKIGRFDVDAIIENRDQLWAEASYLDACNPDPTFIRLDPSLYGAAAAEQEKRRVVDPVQTVLEDALHGVVGAIRSQDLWKLVKSSSERLPTMVEQRQISAGMRILGFSPSRTAIGGIRGTYYIRGTGVERSRLIRITGSDSQGWTVQPPKGVK